MVAVVTKWTSERREQVAAMIEKGKTYREIGKVMGESATAVRGAAQRYGLMRADRLVRGQPWSRDDYDTLVELVEQGMPFAEIANRMGRTFNGIRAAVYRLGMTDKARQQHRLRSDWHEIMPIVERCIEVELMAMPQIVSRLHALGYTVTGGAIHHRLRSMDQTLRKRLRRNAAHRRAIKTSLRAKRRAAQRKRHQENVA